MEELKSEKYKGFTIKCEKYSNGVKCYVPFGSLTVIKKSKGEALAYVKDEIDRRGQAHKKKESGFKTLKFPQKRMFYYKISKQTRRTYGGMNVTAEVYEQMPNGMEHLGQVKWVTASYKGEESEVLDFLKKQGKIPKEMFPEGYYGWSDAEKYNVQIRRL